MIILGIDPGTTRIGFGIIQKDKNKLTPIHYGVISQSPDGDNRLEKKVTDELQKLIETYKPDRSAVEKIFFFKNHKTVISVSEMRGVILSALASSNIPIDEFTPLQVKQAVSGYGRADKSQVGRMTKLILGIKEHIRLDDATDGLAIAICCANNIR